MTDQSHLIEGMADPKGRPTFLLLDSPVTKRKSFSFVLDESEQPLYAASTAAEAFQWLISEGIGSIILVQGLQHVRITLTFEKI